MAEELNIKQRLDLIDGGVSGTKFTSSIINNWKVYTSSTGLITATLEIDIRPIVLNSTDVAGILRADKTIKENFPVGLFKEVINVDFKLYSTENPNFVFSTGVKSLYTKDYTGEHYILGYNSIFEKTPIIPNSIFASITAIGF
ncbi:MAG: hypothetical protein RSD67_08485 [Oscillospiraceae bacterium]